MSSLGFIDIQALWETDTKLEDYGMFWDCIHYFPIISWSMYLVISQAELEFHNTPFNALHLSSLYGVSIGTIGHECVVNFLIIIST